MEPESIVHNLPLLELFNQLRQAGLPLGVDEYQLLICALQSGFGISDQLALAQLCKTIWTKSLEEQVLLDYHFKHIVWQPMVVTNKASSDTSLPQQPPREKKEPFYQRLWRHIKRFFRIRRRTKQLSEPVVINEQKTETTPQFVLEMDDEVQVAKAVLQLTRENEVFSYNYSLETDEYFPLTQRQMKQSWRYLRYSAREGPPTELDLEATVNEIGRKGILIAPVLVPRRRNRADLLLLIDYGGSMVSFHSLAHRLVETASRGGKLGQANRYYFHNCPADYLYRDPALYDAEALKDVLDMLHHVHTGVLIISDAGAARGGFNPERIRLTTQFLYSVESRVRYIAWLNPMPQERWKGTTAEALTHLVPMFDVSRHGLDSAIRVLRGRLVSSVYNEVEENG